MRSRDVSRSGIISYSLTKTCSPNSENFSPSIMAQIIPYTDTYVLVIFARMFSLSKGPKWLFDDIQTGLRIFIPESGHTSECNSDSTSDTSSTSLCSKYYISWINRVMSSYMRITNKDRPHIIRILKYLLVTNYNLKITCLVRLISTCSKIIDNSFTEIIESFN